MKRTTVRLDDALLDQARREAYRRGQTLTSMIENGLRLQLANARPNRLKRKVRLILSKARGGVLPGVDLNDSAGLLDRLEPPEKIRKGFR